MPINTDIFPPFIDDLIEFRVASTNQGVACLNVMYVLGDPLTPYGGNASSAALAIFAFFDDVSAALNSGWTCDNIISIDRSVANGEELLHTPVAPIVGALGTEVLPLQTQMCVTWRTANSGRRYRGRSYLGGWTVDANTATGELAAGTIALVQTAADDLLTALDTADQHLAVLSRGKVTTLPDVAPPSAPDWEGFATPVTNAIVRPGWDVLRSRRS